MSVRVGSNELWMAGIAVVWSGSLLFVDVPMAAWLGLGWGAVVLIHRASPTPAVFASAVLWIAGALVGIPETNAAALLPMLIVYFGVGRYLASVFSVALILVGLLPLGFGPWQAQIPDYVFAALLYTLVWGAGRALQHRAQKVDQAWAVARSLTAIPYAASAAGTNAIDSLGELTDSFFNDVLGAVEKIRQLAAKAQADLAPQQIEAILKVGSDTVSKLKKVVVSLRVPPGLILRAPAPVQHRQHEWVPWVGYPALVILLGLDVALAPDGFNALTFVVGILMIMLCFLGRFRPVLGAWLVAGLLVITVLPFIPLPEGLGPAVIYGVITWRLAPGKFKELGALIGVLATLVIALWFNAPWNIPINLGTIGLVAFASRTWRQHELDEDAALATAEHLRDEFTRVLNAAVASEGLALSRLIHDATSHSVGVLMIQANAALALIEMDPSASRKSLRLVDSAGAEAHAELTRLASERQKRIGGSPRAELERLITQLTSTGISVSVFQEIRPGAMVDPVLYKVAAEGVFNAARHAPGSSVKVVLQASTEHSGVEVSNGPAIAGTPPTPGSGQGLIGLNLELTAVGGTLRFGSTPHGGFTLHASIPARQQTSARTEPHPPRNLDAQGENK